MVVTAPDWYIYGYGRPSTLRDLQEADRAGRGSDPARPRERARRVREARGGKEAEVLIAAGPDRRRAGTGLIVPRIAGNFSRTTWVTKKVLSLSSDVAELSAGGCYTLPVSLP
jgi:hypothetical protein